MSADRAYDIVNLRPGGGGLHQPHVRVHCSNCTNLLEFQVANSPPPEHIAKKIRGKGWEFDLGNRRYTRCPECIRVRDAQRKGESPGPKQIAVELFGKKVELPVTVVPAELVPPPAPAREPVVFRKDQPPAPEEPEITAVPTRDLDSVATAVMSLSRNIADLVVTMKATLKALHAPAVAAHEIPAAVPLASTRTEKAPEHVAKLRKSMRAKSDAYTERVRNALQTIRRKKTNGREPSLHEYVKNLNAMGVEPFRPGRPWSPSIVQKHLDAMDSR